MFKHVPSSRFRAAHQWRSLMMLCGCVCIAVLPLTSTFAQDEQTTNNKPGQSVVRGRVIFADSEQPLRRAVLRLRRELNRDFVKRAISGKRGEFSFQGVPAGTYYVEVDAPGVLSSSNSYSLTDLGFSVEDTNLTLVTVDGTNDVKTEVRATRGGSITGRISYSDGEPATRARVVLYRQKGETPVLFFLTQTILTDDRGAYRIEGLPSGQYVVGGIENNSGGGKTYPRDSPGLVTAYHPAAPSVASATAVNVELGSETRDVNIKFADEPRQISGTLKWKESDLAIKNAIVFLRRVGEPQMNLDFRSFMKMMAPYGGDKSDLLIRDMALLSLMSTNLPYIQSDDTGKWSFEDVPPGTYVVVVDAPVPTDERAKPNPSPDNGEDFTFDSPDLPDFSKGELTGSAEVTIKDKNVDNVLIELTRGGSIAGSVVVDGELGSISISAKGGSNGLISLLEMPTFVKPDRTFLLQSVRAGSIRLDISEPGETHYYVRSITVRGLDLMKDPLTLADGEQVTGVQMVLGNDLATIEGRVVAASGGASVAGSGVVIVPVEERNRNLRSGWGLARADAEGKFTMRLPPGEYFVLAWSPANEPTDPLEVFVRTQLATARRASLQPNELKTLEVQVSASVKQ